MKKVKAVPACTASNKNLEEQFKPTQLKVKRQVKPAVKRPVRTSAAMIGLIISTGASNLLLIRPSDSAPAAEPLTNEQTVAGQAGSINHVEPEVEKSVFSTIVTPTPLVQLAAETVSIPAPLVERSVQKRQKLSRGSQKAQPNTAAKLTQPFEQKGLSEGLVGADANSVPKQPDLQAEVVKNHQLRLIHRLKASDQAPTSSKSDEVNSSKLKPSVLAASEPLEKSVPVINQASSASTAKQRLLINRLKQKPNRLKDSLAESRSEESNNSSIPVKDSFKAVSTNQNTWAPFAVGVTKQQQPSLRSPQVVKSQQQPAAVVVTPEVQKAESQTLKQESLPPLAVGAAQQQSMAIAQPEVAAEEIAVVGSEKLQQPAAVAVVPELPKTAVDQPTVVIPSAEIDYQVKAGDTLTAIASTQGVPISKLVRANHLTNPNLLEINQQIKIPTFKSTSTASQSTADRQQQLASLPLQTITSNESKEFDLTQPHQQMRAAVTVPPVPKAIVNEPNLVFPATEINYQVKAGDTLTTIASTHSVPLAEIIKANNLADPNLLEINQQVKIPASQSEMSASMAFNPASDSQSGRPSVPPDVLARTQSLGAAYTGIGGNISDDDTVKVSSPRFEKTQLTQSAAKPELQSELYVQNLRTDIQKLRQKYYAQNTVSQVVPAVAAKSSEVLKQQFQSSPTANQPVNPEFRVAQAAKTLQPTGQKRRSIPAKSAASGARNKETLATTPIGIDAAESLENLSGQQVSPELPPLGAVDTYLPKSGSDSFKGFIWPAKGALTSGYGWRWGRMHKGIDIAAPIGTPIVAAAPGVVVKAGWNSGGYGNLVDIKHADGTLTRYAHNKRILVQAGQQVQQGQQISEMGSTGFSTGPHLHFEVHALGKKAVNPIAYLPR